ncbi:MAG: hypothetical protein C5B50_17365 [Verrucomicrobia bacterium]|nr:MAG: hypothetical protein C5B50_17365 [Verrucomicrobiota bacterium]
MADKTPIKLRNAQGSEFLLSPADDFASEVELLRRNHEFLSFLDERSRSRKRRSIDEVERDLLKEE